MVKPVTVSLNKAVTVNVALLNGEPTGVLSTTVGAVVSTTQLTMSAFEIAIQFPTVSAPTMHTLLVPSSRPLRCTGQLPLCMPLHTFQAPPFKLVLYL